MAMNASPRQLGMRTRVLGLPQCLQHRALQTSKRFQSPRRYRSAERHLRRATGNEDQQIEELKRQLQEKVPKEEKLVGEGNAKTEDKSLAIVTGAISIVIGVLYLAGVTLLNGSRGSHLEAPPPEAFGWIAGQMLHFVQ